MKYLKAQALFFVLFAFSISSHAQDEDVYKDKVVVKTISGIKFQVPEDMPIVKRNNTLMALPMEEYVYWKFSKMEDSLAGIANRVSASEQDISSLQKNDEDVKLYIEDLESRLNEMKLELKETRERTWRTEDSLRETKARLKELESRFDETSKTLEELLKVQKELKSISERLKSVERDLEDTRASRD